MLRSFPGLAARLVWISAAITLAACSGSTDDRKPSGGGEVTQEAPVSVSADFTAAASTPLIAGTPPYSAQFTGGSVPGTGAWVIAEGETATVDLTTPADLLSFDTVAGVAAGVAVGSSKTGTGTPPVGSQAVSPPFDIPMFVRGTVQDSWAASGRNRLREVADNVLEVKIDLEPGDYEFKVADADWTGPTNCGAFESKKPVSIGVPFTLSCESLSQNLLLTISEANTYTFSFNAAAPSVTVSPPDSGNGGGGDGEPEPVVRISVLDTTGTPINEIEDLTGNVSVSEEARGGAARIARVVIENLGGAGGIGVQNFKWTSRPEFRPASRTVSIYYRNQSGDYSGTTITVGGQTLACSPDGSFGCRVTGVSFTPYTALTYTVNDGGGTETITAFPGDGSQGLYTFAGSGSARVGAPAGLPSGPDEVILYYFRPDGEYDGWGLHLFPVTPSGPSWTNFPTPGEYLSEGIDPVYGAYFRIALPQNTDPPYSANPDDVAEFPEVLGFIIHRGDIKDPGPDQFIRIAEGNVVFVVSEVNDVGTVPPGGAASLRIKGPATAHWVTADTLLWDLPEGATQVRLLASADASIKAGLQGLSGNFESVTLSSTTAPTLDKQRHLAGLDAWALPAAAVATAKDLARQQLVAMGYDSSGNPVGGTLVQKAGALDDLYADAAYDQPLGVTYAGSAPSLAVWAPTALTDPGVSVKLYEADGTLIDEVPMTLDEASGIWRVDGTTEWDRKFYTINLQVYSGWVDAIVTNEVTDPYSVGLATDSVRSQFVNLDDADLKPAGWDTLVKPAIEAPEDIVIYELHVRDFSIADTSVPAADRGKFTAFDVPGTAGRTHLEALAAAGLTHVHVLPAFDIATIKENPADRVELDDPVEALCAANAAAASLCTTDAGKTIRQAMEDAVGNGQLERPQQIANWLRDLDGFNWGYDPYHFGAPEGSYSTDPNGPQRILEFRRMVKGLADAGLGTIMDVVYNHTNETAQGTRSVLERIVPTYYQRFAENGLALFNSCCPDTAVEFRMMEKLMVDTGVRWVKDYKVDGFRFDLMSFHPLSSMEAFRDAVQAVNPDVYLYGEGWNFGAIQDDRRFLAARQANLAGTGIGSFSDRIRDPVRGGGPFNAGTEHIANQGFMSGWYYDPNSANTGSNDDRLELIADTDNIRVWMAGGLKTFSFENSEGATTLGQDVDYRGQDSGYTADPQEAINYISKHDNETLWDISQYKHPANTPLADRVRAHNVGLSVVLLGQGIPFLHAGSDIIRSKSMDRNSYDSGDWFNELIWDMSTTKWNQGLPIAGDNQVSWNAQLTATVFNVNAVPDMAAQQRVFDHVQEMLRIRKSSSLFRLRTGAEIEKRVTFENTGPFQVPGLIAMRIDGCTDPSGLSPAEGAIMVIVNASDDPRTLGYYPGEAWTLHPVQAASADPVVRTASHGATGFFVPARTTAVFVRAEQTSCAPYTRELFVRGGFNGWAADEAFKFAFLGGVDYSVTAPVTAGSYGFKVADATWTAGTDCGGLTSGVIVGLGSPVQLNCNGGPDLTLDAPSTGDYAFSLDASDTTNPVLAVEKTPPLSLPLYVRGLTTADWSVSPERLLAWDGASKWQVVINDLPAQSYQFKIADADWGSTTGGATNCGAGANGTVTVGQPYTLLCPSNDNLSITFPTTGSYLFSVDASDPAALELTVEKTPFDVALFVRGLQGDWDPGTRMNYVGAGRYRTSLILPAGADEFKIADASWGNDTGGATNCGSSTPIEIDTPLGLDCSSSSGNIGLTLPSPGTYEFSLVVPGSGAPELTVSGP